MRDRDTERLEIASSRRGTRKRRAQVTPTARERVEGSDRVKGVADRRICEGWIVGLFPDGDAAPVAAPFTEGW